MNRNGTLLRLLAAIVILVTMLPAQVAGQEAEQATLTILGGKVEVGRLGVYQVGVDGQSVRVGERVRTDSAGRAVVTFFDGTAVTLDPLAEIEIKTHDPGSSGGQSSLSITQFIGRTWTRVARLFDRRTVFQIETPTGTAVVRDAALVGALVNPDGSLKCWTIAGVMTFTAQGKEVTVNAGQETTIPAGQASPPPIARPTPPAIIELELVGRGWPRIVDPLGRTLGFVGPGVPINQFLNANQRITTAARTLRLPAPPPGKYAIIVDPSSDGGPATLGVKVSAGGAAIFSDQIIVSPAPMGITRYDLTLTAEAGAIKGASLKPASGSAGRFKVMPADMDEAWRRLFPGTAPIIAPIGPVGAGYRYFPVTGHLVGNGFLKHFDLLGGLERFGYPRSEEIVENGVVVQYFQRARMEWRPGAKGGPVQLGLISDELKRAQPKPATPAASGRLYAETGHAVDQRFLSYFDQMGGVESFGYPISPAVVEGGLTVQYFQRARLELHPDSSGKPTRILVGILGDESLHLRGALP